MENFIKQQPTTTYIVKMIKKGDFVELDFVGIIEKTGEVFDTTIKEEAEKAGIYDENTEYSPVIICVGEAHILKAIDDFLIGKEPGNYTLKLNPEEAFGSRNPKLLKLISKSNFTRNKIEPFIGLRVNIDGFLGTITSITSNRVLVDFNHPLAGKNIVYKLIIKRIVDDDAEKARAIINLRTGLKPKIELREEGKNRVLIIKNFDERFSQQIPRLKEEIKKLLNLNSEFEGFEAVKNNQDSKKDNKEEDKEEKHNKEGKHKDKTQKS